MNKQDDDLAFTLGVSLENNNLKEANKELLSGVKLALGAFENNNCIDWNILSDLIAKHEVSE